jgi:hypothetical protein
MLFFKLNYARYFIAGFHLSKHKFNNRLPFDARYFSSSVIDFIIYRNYSKGSNQNVAILSSEDFLTILYFKAIIKIGNGLI